MMFLISRPWEGDYFLVVLSNPLSLLSVFLSEPFKFSLLISKLPYTFN